MASKTLRTSERIPDQPLGARVWLLVLCSTDKKVCCRDRKAGSWELPKRFVTESMFMLLALGSTIQRREKRQRRVKLPMRPSRVLDRKWRYPCTTLHPNGFPTHLSSPRSRARKNTWVVGGWGKAKATTAVPLDPCMHLSCFRFTRSLEEMGDKSLP